MNKLFLVFIFSKKGNQYIIKDGKIYAILYRETYTIDNKPIEFYCKNGYELSKGDELITNSILYQINGIKY